jgi:hypothetical protein
VSGTLRRVARNVIANLTTGGVPLNPFLGLADLSGTTDCRLTLALRPEPGVLISTPQQRRKRFLVMARTVPSVCSARKRPCDPEAGQQRQKRLKGAPSDPSTKCSTTLDPVFDSKDNDDTLALKNHDDTHDSLLLLDFHESPKASCSCSMAKI